MATAPYWILKPEHPSDAKRLTQDQRQKLDREEYASPRDAAGARRVVEKELKILLGIKIRYRQL